MIWAIRWIWSVRSNALSGLCKRPLSSWSSDLYGGWYISDHYVMKQVGYARCLANADPVAKKYARTMSRGAEVTGRFLKPACIFLEKFFLFRMDPKQLPGKKMKMSGEWAVWSVSGLKAIACRTIYPFGVGPMSVNCVDVAIELANEHKVPLMLIARP